ncbi:MULTISPECIES: efflux RND transporter permease subunit [unclassified Pseudoalteromonas]|uniref:efflux RND transporter permease subunit n=1 Tax=unclassified Pseudoalteromonas TaxID=194690 RepID=UPI0025B3D381|nr:MULTISPECIES: efflux RND transporter permease subunit [unclassified Pseudoalteromonas]MDN3377771.1 efflux RND transporter permease subunit [Pseudoalteromonas sp. APC 3893]MDN3385967.1 efflux RND transporter permease subunit [Pseudoalteromonas sp. APC 4017]
MSVQPTSQQPNSNSPLHGIISWFANNSVAANLLLISVIVMGIMSLTTLRKEAFPSLEPDTISVSVVYDSGDALQAEEGIALKIEEALETVPGIKRITSTSNASGSHVSIEKKTDYSLDELLTDVKNQVDAINNFPVDAEQPVIDKARRQDHALSIHLYGDTDRHTLQNLGEQLKADLLAKSGISDVEQSGVLDPMMSVEIDEGKLQAYGLTLSDISEVINNESSSPLSTSLRDSNKIMRLKAAEQAYWQRDFADIVLLTTATGTQITLGDVATVTDTFAEDTNSLSRYNQQNAVGIEILMDENSDITSIVEQAHSVIDTWHERGLLPQNVELESWNDKSTMITERLSLLTKNAATGIIMVFVILAIFLNVRVALWVAGGLPFVFFGTLYFMTDGYTALTINEMTTFGFIMALGIVVDDAVVVGESIYTTRKSDGDTLHNTIAGTMKVAVPTIFGVLTTVAAFVALSNVSGNLGKIYSQFATVVTICLLLSVVESKLILPSHLAHINTKRQLKSGLSGLWSKVQHGADNGLNWFSDNVYRRVIEYSLRFRYAIVAAFVAFFILVIGMPMTGAVKVGFFPSIAEDTVTAELVMQNDAAFGQTNSNLLALEQSALQAQQNLMTQFDSQNSEITSLQVVSSSDISGTVTIELLSEGVFTATEFAQEWQRLAGVPEGSKKLQVLATRKMVDNFKVELKAWDDETVMAAGALFKKRLQNTAGVNGIDDNLNPGQPQLKFALNAQGRALGMDTASLSQQVLQAFGGAIVQRYQRDKDEVKVRVRYPENARKTPADIMQSRIRLPDGTVVPLVNIATISSEYQQDEITRIDGLRAIYLGAQVDKNVIAPNELVDALNRDLVPELTKQFPNLSIHFAGEAEEQDETTSSMSSMFIAALLVIYVLLAIPLKSYIQPVLIMVAIPFGIVGAILGHWWNDLTISILSLNGILALSGVVVNDSLLLVSRFNELVKDEGMSTHDAIIESCTSRLRAVMLTSITTYAGLVPLLSETSIQAQFLIPAAASLGYGILFATVITLILIPALLMIQIDIKRLLVTMLNFFTGNKTQGTTA